MDFRFRCQLAEVYFTVLEAEVYLVVLLWVLAPTRLQVANRVCFYPIPEKSARPSPYLEITGSSVSLRTLLCLGPKGLPSVVNSMCLLVFTSCLIGIKSKQWRCLKGSLTGPNIAIMVPTGLFLSLAKPLIYILKVNHQGLFLYLATVYAYLMLRMIIKVHLSKHQGPAIKIHYLATLSIMPNQDIPTHPSTHILPFFLKRHCWDTCCCLCLIQRQPTPQLVYPLR